MGDTQMKEFIYLNTDYINSFLAQKYNGIPTSTENETSKSIEKTKTEQTGYKTHKKSYSLGIPDVIAVTKEIQPQRYEEINQLSNTSFGREMITKILHDNSYDLFFNNIDLEKYTLIEDYMRIYDLTAIADVMGQEFLDIFRYNTPSVEEILSTLNRSQRRDSKIKKEAKKMENQNKEELRDIELAIKAIKLLSKLFPSDVYVYIQNYFIPFKRRFFREEISSINYIYTSKTTIMGRVTGTIGNVLRPKYNNEFDAAINSLYDVGIEGLKLLGINENANILIPISWYSE